MRGRAWKLLLLPICLGAASLAPPAPARADDAADEAAIAAVIDASIGWFATKDFDRLYASLADDEDLFIFHPDSKSTIRGAAAFREFSRFFATPGLAYAGHEIRDLKIDLSGGRDAAWWSAMLEDCSEMGGRKSCWHDCRWTGVVEKRDGRWVIAQMHFSFADDQVAAEADRRGAREFGTYQEMRGLVGELFGQERYAEAAAVLAGAVARYPERVMANTFNLALAYARLGERQEAVRALEDGHRRGVFYGKWGFDDGVWDSLRTMPEFGRVVARNEELIAQAQKRSAPRLEIVTPAGYQPGREYPLFIALHGGGENLEQFKPHWTSPRLREEFILAYVQSSQVASMDGFHWDDEAITRRELAEAYRDVAAQHAVDERRVVVGGFSSGGFATLLTTIEGTLPAAGFVILCPEVPADPPAKTVAKAVRRGLRGTLLTTEMDGRLERQRQYQENLAKQGLDVRLVVTPNAGHWYPDDLERLIDEALGHLELPGERPGG